MSYFLVISYSKKIDRPFSLFHCWIKHILTKTNLFVILSTIIIFYHVYTWCLSHWILFLEKLLMKQNWCTIALAFTFLNNSCIKYNTEKIYLGNMTSWQPLENRLSLSGFNLDFFGGLKPNLNLTYQFEKKTMSKLFFWKLNQTVRKMTKPITKPTKIELNQLKPTN